jgi:hypothetical protein
MARMMDFVPGELSLEEKNTLTDAVLRYFYYVEYGVPTKHIAPFREEWAGNALAMVPQEPPEKVQSIPSDKHAQIGTHTHLRILTCTNTHVHAEIHTQAQTHTPIRTHVHIHAIRHITLHSHTST